MTYGQLGHVSEIKDQGLLATRGDQGLPETSTSGLGYDLFVPQLLVQNLAWNRVYVRMTSAHKVEEMRWGRPW